MQALLQQLGRLLVSAPAPPLRGAQRLLARAIASSRPLLGMEEFFAAPLKDGSPLQRAGRSWTAAELRNKSFADLHVLWFLCLKERNLLLTERLYYRQVGMAAADPQRLGKVRATMALIKVVIGERARAAAALRADQARAARVSAVSSALSARLELSGNAITGASSGGVAQEEAVVAAAVARAEALASGSAFAPATSATAVTPTPGASDGADTTAAVSRAQRLRGASGARARAQDAVATRLAGRVMVTFKRFGRKYTVPEDAQPALPTRQERLRAERTRRYFGRARAILASPPMLAPPSPAFVWATTGVPVAQQREAHRKARRDIAAASSASAGARRGPATAPAPAPGPAAAR